MNSTDAGVLVQSNVVSYPVKRHPDCNCFHSSDTFILHVMCILCSGLSRLQAVIKQMNFFSCFDCLLVFFY